MNFATHPRGHSAGRRAAATLALATALTGVAGSLAIPAAHADTLDDIRAAVNGMRAGSTCGPLNYNFDLEGEAQAFLGNTASTAPRGGYKGTFFRAMVGQDPASRSISELVSDKAGAIKDCRYKDFGVGFLRDEEDEWSNVSIALGEPTPPPPPPPPPPVAPAPVPEPAPAPAPAPPVDAPKPLRGPAVSTKTGLVGVTFTVSDRSGVASQCTYSSTEGYTDSFGLPANGSFDLFVPAVRLLQERTGTITCDNGTSTNTSVFF